MSSPPDSEDHKLVTLDLDPPEITDAYLATDVATCKLSIRSRATPNVFHSNWAGTFHSRPEFLFEPETIEEVQQIVALARCHRRRVVAVGISHSPSDLTCTSSWMVDLRRMNRLLEVRKLPNKESVVLVQSGIYLHELNHELSGPRLNLEMPSLGSIDVQSLAGAIATGTHGSSLKYGLLSQNVRGLRIVLADGRAVWCDADTRKDLFRAALVSLGALGIVTEIAFAVEKHKNLAWEQNIMSLSTALDRWNKDLWTQREYVRCWWMPYLDRMIEWKGSTTDAASRAPKTTFYEGRLGFQVYRALLWVSHYFPKILPSVEWFVFGMQNRFSCPGHCFSGVGSRHKALLMDCLFSQFVNEWALPLSKGPEAIRRLSAWIHGRDAESGIPFSSKGVWVHCPIEVRVADGTATTTPVRGFLDPSCETEPTLYLNATLYRPFGKDPPCRARYYEAFEWLMKDLNARPHWAKNFAHVEHTDLRRMYDGNLDSWLDVRRDIDPEGMFVGAWHRRLLLGEDQNSIFPLALEEQEIGRSKTRDGGMLWYGSQKLSSSSKTTDKSISTRKRTVISAASEESFNSAEASTSTESIVEVQQNEDS